MATSKATEEQSRLKYLGIVVESDATIIDRTTRIGQAKH